jgi:hypothetical protein
LLKKFGFTGDSTFIKDTEIIKKIFEVGSKGLYSIFVVLGTVLLSVGSAFAGGLKFSEEWDKLNSFISCLLFLVSTSYFALGAGSIFLIIGTLGTYYDQDKQQKQNDSLNLENKKLIKNLDNLKEGLNSTQEELQQQKNENKN